MTTTYRPDAVLNAAVQAILDLKPDAVTGVVTHNQILSAIADNLDVLPESVRGEVDRNRLVKVARAAICTHDDF